MWGIFLYLKFPFLYLLWIDVPYPLRPCSSATRSLKFFLFSFPDVISSLIFSVPQNFTPILLHHRHCCPVRFLSAFPVQPPSSWAEGFYLTHFRSSLALRWCHQNRVIREIWPKCQLPKLVRRSVLAFDARNDDMDPGSLSWWSLSLTLLLRQERELNVSGRN